MSRTVEDKMNIEDIVAVREWMDKANVPVKDRYVINLKTGKPYTKEEAIEFFKSIDMEITL